jgi:flavodoxin
MKTIIIYKSIHKMNTEKIAKAIAQAMDADLTKVEDVQPEGLEKYDLIGFGSGVYASRFHKKIYKFIEKMSSMNRNVFIFCTSGSAKGEEKQLLKKKLLEKGCKILGEFSCSGEFSPFGFNIEKKGCPDEHDLESAREFAKGLLNLQLKKESILNGREVESEN